MTEAEEKAKAMLQEIRDHADMEIWTAEQAILELFPELAESEDEQARKGLINFLNQPLISDKITFEARIKWLTYLEKQKEHFRESTKMAEQKPVE